MSESSQPIALVTGASTADLAVILVDARKGVLEQSKRHAYISTLLGIPHLAVAVNKMDLVDFDEEIFDAHVTGELSVELKALPDTQHALSIAVLGLGDIGPAAATAQI